MAVDYIPVMGDYKTLQPFRYWCQKVLPLVYDDSLSYYELLCKVVDYLNKTMEDVETLHGDVEALADAYEQLQTYVNNYFDNLDVQEEINNKLDAMASNGTLSNLIEPFIPDIISGWLAEHITPTTPAIDNTLSVSGAGADAKVTGDKFAEARTLTNTLNGDNAITLSDFDGSVAINGAYAKRVNGKLALYGTESGSRYLRCLNGEISVYTSQMSFNQTLPAGKYKVNLHSDNFLGDLYIAYTTSTFANANFAKDGDIIITDSPIMVAFFVAVNTVYGTEADPSLIDISITKYEEKVNVSTFDEVTEDTKNLIRFENMVTSEAVGYSGFSALLNGFTEELPAGTYTLSFIAESDTDINYLYLGVYKTSSSQTVNRMVWQTVPKTGDVSHITFTVAEPIKSIYFWAMPTQGESQNHLVTIKAIQLESGADYSDIIQHNVTATDFIARNEIAKLRIGESIKTYTLFKSGFINTSDSTLNPSSPTQSSEWEHIVVPCKEGEDFIFNCVGGDYEKLLFAFCDANNNILSKSYQSGLLGTYSFPAYENLHSNKAPANSSYVVVNHHKRAINGYTPKVYKLSDSEVKNYIAKKITAELPYEASYTWQNLVVATLDNSIVINDKGVLKLSTDLGETWNTGLDVSSLGELVNYHLYNNGTLGFFSVTNAYYTSDWQTYHNAPCYEADGSAFTPQATNNFNSLWEHKERKIVSGKDMYVFGNYDTSTPHLRAIVWYSADQGHSYKIAYEFDLESTYPARHVHDVIYYQPEDVFIVGTGDSNATECSVYALTYNATNDTWSAEKLGGSARAYKWANIAIYRDEIYYAYDNTPGAVKKCKYADIGDLTKHETVIDNLENDTLSIAFSSKGELVVIQSYARSTGGQEVPTDMSEYEGSRLMYYSSDRKNFSSAILPLNFINGFAPQCRVLPILSNGKCFIGTDRNNRLTSVDIGDFLNTVGFAQAFKPF